MELNLEDDYQQEFEGGRLLISGDVRNAQCENEDTVEKSIVEVNHNNDENDWKYYYNFITPITQLKDSIWSKKDALYCDRKNSTSSSATPNVETVNNFFTSRSGIVENAIEECVDELFDSDADSQLVDAFLLTEINIWDTEKERLVLLTSKTLLIVKYDFIALKRLESKKISLDTIDSIVIGDLVYPNKSLLANRNVDGIRMLWNKGKPIDFGTKWNPFSNNVPFVTLTSHPLVHHDKFTDTNAHRMYDIQEFIQRTCELITNLDKNQILNNNTCIIEHKSILLENYIGIGSMLHNKTALGYFKVRGKFSF